MVYAKRFWGKPNICKLLHPGGCSMLSDVSDLPRSDVYVDEEIKFLTLVNYYWNLNF